MKQKIWFEENKEHRKLAVEKHHKDYDKPLEVELVCIECHKILDKEVRKK